MRSWLYRDIKTTSITSKEHYWLFSAENNRHKQSKLDTKSRQKNISYFEGVHWIFSYVFILFMLRRIFEDNLLCMMISPRKEFCYIPTLMFMLSKSVTESVRHVARFQLEKGESSRYIKGLHFRRPLYIQLLNISLWYIWIWTASFSVIWERRRSAALADSG